MTKILVVEDDAAVRSLLVFLLHGAGHSTSEAETGAAALAAVRTEVPDLALLDRMLPDVDGLEVLREWRRQAATAQLPVIMLTARAEESDRVAGLRDGADDYVTKPFSREELLLRIEKLLRRRAGAADRDDALEIAGIKIDRRSVRVALDDEPITLGAIEFRLLDLLASSAERVHTRGEIIDKVWRHGGYVDPRTVDVHIRRLRRVLEPRGYDRLIQTVRGVGYRFSLEPG